MKWKLGNLQRKTDETKSWFSEKIDQTNKPGKLRKERGFQLLISERKEGHHYRSHGREKDNEGML